MLRFFGLDPNEVMQEIENSKKEREDIERNFDQKLTAYKEKWNQWVLRYKALLQGQKQIDEERREKMNKVNPAFILRNYLLENAITKAEKGDFSGVIQLFECAKKPFEEPNDKSMMKCPPVEAFTICVSCSS